jgi:hypothetical protein
MNRYSQSDWNVVRDLDELRKLTQSPGGTPSRWVRQMAAEIIRLRSLVERIETLAAGNVIGCGTCVTIIDAIRAGEPQTSPIDSVTGNG